jgi:hypothetical protein
MKELYIEDGFGENGSTFKMEADGSSETLVTIYERTEHPVAEDRYLHPQDTFVHNLYKGAYEHTHAHTADLWGTSRKLHSAFYVVQVTLVCG